MVNIVNKRCMECDVSPSFNLKGEKNPLYCVNHKKEGMVDVISKTCLEIGCNKQPCYNNSGETKPLYCNQHKINGMVDVKNKTCIENGCNKQPTHNNQCELKGLYCGEHKKTGMVYITKKTCVECKTIPVYNVKGEKKGLYCKTHKKDGMIDVHSKSCLNCDTRATFNTEGETTPLYCVSHKKEGMVDIKSKTCKTELCFKQVKEKYDGYCLFCYMNLFPEKPVARNYKTKEYAVVEYVKKKFKDFSWIADRKVSDGCSKRRPDLLLDLGYQIIVVEVDENQHTDYDCSCENKRTMELSQDLGHRPIVFIRFNPDEYTKNETNISSCWGVDKKGICVVKKSKKEEWSERLKCLEEHINYWTTPENTTSKTVEIIQLYYDM
jgi:hypothetical protein